MAKKDTRRGMTGRSAAGIRPGEKVSDYRQFPLRLPEDVRIELGATAGALRRPAWRVMIDAFHAYIGKGPALTEDERHAVKVVLRLHQP